MSPERPPSQDGGPMLESPSLIMSSMPIESSHVILQQHIQYSNQGGGGGDGGGGGNIVINGNGAVVANGGGGSRSVNGQGAVSVDQSGSSKLLVLQQSGENYIAATNENNGVGNIVLLATEQMEINPNGEHNGIVTAANGADEELTPLTWLHNKDLLKGINLSCAKGQSNSDTLIKQNAGAISPTSDFLEDSCISEDNTSSIVSNSDQSIGVYSTETSPKLYTSPNNNNNTINKNRNHLTTATRTSTSTVQVSPGGTTTVIEYHSSGKQQNGIVGQSGGNVSSSGGASTSTSTITTSTTTSTPHQHFHKKYLREEHVKTLRQNQNDSGFVSPTTVGQQYESPQQQPLPPPPVQQTIISPQPVSPLRGHRNSGSGGHQNQKTSLSAASSKLKHPTNQPYDPQVHTTNKPPFSFSSLIFMAIEDASEKALPVKEIYAWIVKHFPYFKTAPTGWKNSVRHNLSLNKCFQKVEKAPNMGKGSLWRVEQQYRQNLIQALTRSPFHPFSTFDKTVYKTQQGSNDSNNVPKSSSGRSLNASLNPRLSKFMAELDAPPPEPPASPPIEDEYRHLTSYSYYENGTNAMLNVLVNSENGGCVTSSSNGGSPEKIVRDWGADSSIEDVNAATAMLALKHGPKVFAESFQNGRPVITSSPSEDHTYSAGGNNNGTSTGNLSTNSSTSNSLDNTSNGTSSDAAYESSEESQITSRAQEELEEQRRKAEGVDALLNLAGCSLPPTAPIMLKRSSVDTQSYHYQTSSTDAETPLSSPSPSKRSKQRPIRTKLKKKAAWMR
ncbi:hypothetical protein DMENIID0001_063730 [Sergentomyia squamirostris]